MDKRIASLGIGVGLLVAGLLAGGVAHSAPSREGARHVQPRTYTSVPAVIATIPVGRTPIGVAVTDDDTVYVANFIDSTLSVINPGSSSRLLAEDDTIAVGIKPVSVAVSDDDTVYVANSDDSTLSVINPGSLAEDDTIPVGGGPVGVAVSNDDTVYVTNGGSDTVSVIAPGALTQSYTVAVGDYPTGVAVTHDDTVYVANSSSGWVSVINPGSQIEDDSIYTGGLLRAVVASSVTNSVYVASFQADAVEVIRNGELDDSIVVGTGPVGVAVSESGGALYVANNGAGTVSVLTGSLLAQVATVNVGDEPNAIAVNDGDGLIYVTNGNPLRAGTVSVIALNAVANLTDDTGDPVSSGRSGDSVTLEVDICGQSDCQLMDDSTVQSISFGEVPVTNWVRNAGVNSISGSVPPGSGTVEVTVLFNGGQVAGAGTFTYPSPPAPTPVYPPSAPTGVLGLAGDASAALSWSAPSSPGSFPVTTYEVTASPETGSCITAALSCTVPGLTNGTGYTFKVRALNGAGWSSWSATSERITPTAASTPALVITGTRTQGRSKPAIRVTGTATDLDPGAILRPWIRFPGQSSFAQGTARVVVDERSRFVWERMTGRKVYVYLQTEDGVTRSNRITIPAD